MRKDFERVAKIAAEKSGFSVDAVYWFFWKVAKENHWSAKKISEKMKIENGKIYIDPFNQLFRMTINHEIKAENEADFWEGKILARQDVID